MEKLTHKNHTEAHRQKKILSGKVLVVGFLIFLLIFIGIGIWKLDSPQIIGIIERFSSDNKNLNLGELIWGGNDANVTLLNPDDNYISLSKTININCSGNVTGGAGTLLNLSLYHNATGTWHRNQTQFTDSGKGEFYSVNDDSAYGVFGVNYVGQNFTVGDVGPNTPFTVTLVSLFIFRAGSPQMAQASIFLADAVGEPTGSPLTLGLLNVSGIAEAPAFINFTVAPFTLSAGTNYVLVLNLSSGDAGNNLQWRRDASGPTYASGVGMNSADSGATWTPDSGRDLLFEIWGSSGANDTIASFNIAVDNPFIWNCEGCDTDGDCGMATANRTIFLDTIPPSPIINIPQTLENIFYAGENQTLNWTIIDTNFNSAWWEYNGTNLTLSGANGSTTFALETGLYNGTLWANDSIGNTNSTFMEWDYRIFQNSETFTTTTTSGTINPFILNITTNGVPITLAYLNYNNTFYLGSITSNGNDYILTRNQMALGVSASTNFPFYWNITQSDGFSILTTSQNQTVSPIGVNDTCSSNMYSIFNFTLVDEITQSKLDGSDWDTLMKLDLKLYTSDRDLELVHYFKEASKTNPFAVCIDSNLSDGGEYSLDFQLQYSSTNHSTEFYNVERYVLNSDSLFQNITLYNLDEDNTQKFRLIVRDSSYLAIDGGLVKIERKYLENGTFYITEIPKTDGKGITSASLQVNDVVYNFYIYEDGVLVSSFTNVLAICQTPLVSQCEIDFNAFQSEIIIPDFETGDDFNFTLGYNSTSRVVSNQFVIPSGNPATVQLVVTKEDALGTSVCTDSLTSASGILTCTVASSFGNGTVIAKL